MRVRVGSDEKTGPNDASGVVWAIAWVCFCKYKCFLFIFITMTPCAHETPAIPHPPRLQMRAGGGGFTLHTQPHPPRSQTRAGWVYSQSPPPHLPRSQTRAEGGFTHHHHLTLLARKHEPGVDFSSPSSNQHHPTLLARKREPGVHLPTTPTPPSSLAKRELGCFFHQTRGAQTMPDTSFGP